MHILFVIGCAALCIGGEAAHFQYTDEDFCFDVLDDDAWTVGEVTLDTQAALNFTTESVLEVFDVVRAGLPLAAPRYMWEAEFRPDVGNEVWLESVCAGWMAGGAASYRQQHFQNTLIVSPYGEEFPNNLTMQFLLVSGCDTLQQADWQQGDWHTQMVFSPAHTPFVYLLDCVSGRDCRLAVAVAESEPKLTFDCEAVPGPCSNNADCAPCSGDTYYTCYVADNGTSACAPDQSVHGVHVLVATVVFGGVIFIVGSIASQIAANCFPGDALVVTEGGATRRMADLRMGDRVQVVDGHGRLAFQDIYVFGHADAVLRAQYVRLELQGGAIIELTPDHFLLPACAATAWGACAPVRAADISVGSLLYIATAIGGDLEPVPVVAVSRVVRTGAFNPYTAAGTIVVQGVVASVHSAWFLDGVFDALGLTHWLPAAYQVVLLPVRGLYYGLKAVNGLAVARALEAALADTARNVPMMFSVMFVGVNATAVSVVGLAAVAAVWSKVMTLWPGAVGIAVAA